MHGRRSWFRFQKFATSKLTKVKQIQITPVSAVDPSLTRGALAAEDAQLGTDAQLSEVMATETQSDEVSFWITKVVGLAQEVPPDYVYPLTASKDIDVIFEFPRAKKAIWP